MKWTPGGSTEDIEDRRGQGGGGFRGGPVGIGVVLVLLVLSLLTGRNFLSLVDPNAIGGSDQPSSSGPVTSSPDEDRLVQFVTFVLNDAQATWARLLPGEYQKTTLVLFRDSTPTACGMGQTASGPFYCPGDREGLHRPRVLRRVEAALRRARRLRAGLRDRARDRASRPAPARDRGARPPGAGSAAVGGQRALGAARAAGRLLRRHLGPLDRGARRSSSRATSTTALSAAASIGDDRIQRMSGRGVQPESFTHGSSAQRVEWFKRGFESGDLDACDTFARGTD